MGSASIHGLSSVSLTLYNSDHETFRIRPQRR